MADFGQYESQVYKRHSPYWRFLRNSYLGGRAWYDQTDTAERGYRPFSMTNHTEQYWSGTEQAYLTRHARELDKFYDLRFASSVYWNFMRPLVDGMASAVARNARVTKVPAAIGYITDPSGPGVDGRGQDLADFDRACLVDLIRYGMFHVLIEMPSMPAELGSYEPQTVADLRDLKILPHARLVSPIDLLSWQWDRDTCTYVWILLRECVPGSPPVPFGDSQSDKAKEARWRYRYIDADQWSLRDQDGSEIDAGKGMGFVPLSTAIREQHPFEADPIGVSLVEDVAELAKAVYNKYSWLTEEQRNHAFNQWFLKSPTPLTPQQQVAFGSSTFIGGFEDAKILSPSVEPMQHLEESIQNDVRQRARGMLGLGDSEDSSGVKSGLAIALEGEERAATFSGLAKTFEAGKRQWIMQAAQVAGASMEEIEVRVDRDFSDLASAVRQTQVLAAIKDGGYKGEALASLQKELLVSLMPNIGPDERERVEQAIDETVSQAEKQAQAMQIQLAGQDMPSMNGDEEDHDVTDGEGNGKERPAMFGGK